MPEFRILLDGVTHIRRAEFPFVGPSGGIPVLVEHGLLKIETDRFDLTIFPLDRYPLDIFGPGCGREQDSGQKQDCFFHRFHAPPFRRRDSPQLPPLIYRPDWKMQSGNLSCRLNGDFTGKDVNFRKNGVYYEF